MRAPVILTLAVFLLCAAEPALAKSTIADKTNSHGYYDIKDGAATADVNDPWESFNHPIFDFNVGFDRHIAKPFISCYDTIPGGVRHSVDHFLTNLSEPLNVIHGILQLNPKIAFTSFWRFVLNSTFGLGGLQDFAKDNAGLHNMDQDLGKTMGHWGVPAGPYVVLPIMGPSSVRDTTGRIGDWFADPVGWGETIWLAGGQTLADGIDTRDMKAGVVEHLYYEALDPYVTTRSTYRQHERFEENSKE